MAPVAKRRKLQSTIEEHRPPQNSVKRNGTVLNGALPEVVPPADLTDESSSDDYDIPARSRVAYATLLQSLKPKAAPSAGKSNKAQLKDRSAASQTLGVEPEEDYLDDIEAVESDEELQESEETDHNGNGTSHMPFNDDPEDEDSADPFETHFANPDENQLSKRLKAIESEQWAASQEQVEGLGKAKLLTPAGSSFDRTALHRSRESVDDLKLKRRLIEPATDLWPALDPVVSKICGPMFQYTDVLFGGRTVKNAESLRDITSLHALNHIFKTRDRIIKNNTRLSREPPGSSLELRDQGFTRPKVLLLLETRQSCVKYMDTITSLCAPEQQENKKRFQDAFANNDSKFSEDKPADFRELFEGNDDNEFRLGVKFTRKTIKYYTQFYQSDMILASPLGLRRAITGSNPKKADYDFLSSIEVVIVDQADAMLMQNWEHVEFVFEHLNLQPKEPHGCDFSRIRQWYLDQRSRHLRQTIVFSAYLTPELNGLFSNHMRNVAGRVKFMPEYNGAMAEISMQLRQTFSRFDSPSLLTDPDERFKYFTSTVVPWMTRQPPSADGNVGILVFVPSYLDFVRVRNYFSTSSDVESVSHGAISEYAEISELRRARSHFVSGRYAVLLYSGRAHHFRRHHIRGVRKVVLYGLPENPLFYSEVVAFISASVADGKLDPAEASVRALFSRWDGLSLERIVGTKRVGRMLRDAGDTYEFR